jgi:N-acetylmuramoyl-L-alanine amidase
LRRVTIKIKIKTAEKQAVISKEAIMKKIIICAALALSLAAAVLCIPSAETARTSGDTQLLARAVNGEARGEPYEGQVAVAAVILNRVDHPSFPNSISGVIYQPGAFTAVSDGQIDVPIDPDSTVYKACQDALNGWDPSGGAIYYFNPDTATNAWIWSRPLIKQIGKHRFCK